MGEFVYQDTTTGMNIELMIDIHEVEVVGTRSINATILKLRIFFQIQNAGEPMSEDIEKNNTTESHISNTAVTPSITIRLLQRQYASLCKFPKLTDKKINPYICR